MNKQDIRRLRRPLKLEQNEIATVYGRYVNSRKEIIADFKEDFQWLEDGEAQQYLDLFRESLGGKLGRTMHNIPIDETGEECSLLLMLAALEKAEGFDELLKTLMDRAMRNINFDGRNFVLLLIKNSYDIHKYTPSGRKCKTILDTLNYLMLLVCPVQQGDEELGYESNDSRFHSKILNQVIYSPYLAFTYPCLHDAEVRKDLAFAYCHKGGSDCFPAFLNVVFGPRKKSIHTYEEQKRVINDAIKESISQSFNVTDFLDLQKNMARKMAEFEDGQKEARQFTLEEITEFLSAAGISDAALDDFQERVETQFGSPDVEIPGSLICDQSWTRIEMPTIRISCRPEDTDMIRTEERDGEKFLVIRVKDAVEVNGIKLQI